MAEGLALLVLVAPLAVAVSGLSGIGHRWIDILAQFVAPALVGTCAMLVLLLLLRLRKSIRAAIIVLVLLGFAVWPQWVVPSLPKRDDVPTLTLYSANVWVRNNDVAAIRRSIEAADPDIVILVELGRAPSDQLETLVEGYRFMVTSDRDSQRPGGPRTVIASRYNLIGRVEGDNRLHAIGTTAITPVGRVHVIATHLTRPWPFQFQYGQIIQVEDLTRMQAAMQQNRPAATIIAGDFNSVSTARIGKQVKADMGLMPAPGFPGTWPSALPSWMGMTIDQVWHSPDLVVLDRKVGLANGSDHRPVITRFHRAATPTPPVRSSQPQP